MARPNLNRVEFVKSAASSAQFVQSPMPRIAFAGKSNVGKSSVINRLLNRKNFARVGSEPGKTVHVNYFLIDERAYFIDLPGYGFAKVSRAEKERWSKLMESFFTGKDLYDLGVSGGESFLVVANKLDKLKKSEIEPNLRLIRETLALDEGTRLIPFSAESGAGREELLGAIFPE